MPGKITTEDSAQMEGNIFPERNIHLDSDEPKFFAGTAGREMDGICRARRFLDRHFFQDITLEQMADVACLSKYHFSRSFRQQVGISYCKYLQRLRIAKAKELLADGNFSVTSVCNMVGYGDLTHFERVFRKKVGVSPLIYRKQVKKYS